MLFRSIKWKIKVIDDELLKPRAFVIYMYPKNQLLNPANAGNIHVVLGKDEEKYKFERLNPKRKKFEVRVSVLNRLNMESWLSKPVTIRL